MDFRGQEKKFGMPSSFIYNPSPIREPSSKISPPQMIGGGGGGGGGGGDGDRDRDRDRGRRRDVSAGNGTTTILTPPQSLDHHPHPHHHNQHQQQNTQPTPTPTPAPPPPPSSQDQDSEQDPDPVPVSIAISGPTIAPIGVGGGSNPRTPPAKGPVSSVRYRECLKNHAASIGGHVVDGCGEFMPGGEEGTQEALKCAACECHRNFHRKEIEGEIQANPNCYYYYNSIANTSRSRNPAPPSLPAPPLLASSLHKFPIGASSPHSGLIPPIMMAFGGGGGGGGNGTTPTESSSEELNVFHSSAGGGLSGHGLIPAPPQFGSSKKRFRTKFSQDQKNKMLEFAEKIGWRFQKQDEALVQDFCAEVGVKRQVLKVWMHNNKHSMKKKEDL